MDRPHVLLHVEREFPYPVDVAYAWLTDYADDDHERAGAIIRRRVVVRREHDKDGRVVEVEFDGELEAFGRSSGRGRGLVRLWPDERRWQADLGKGRWVYDYKLVPAGPGRSRLLIDYRFGSKRLRRRILLTLAKPFLAREIHRMWDGFEAAMRKELA